MENLALSIEGLKISYGPIDAVKGIDIAVPQGSVVALLGANGAGKTSTLHAISGLVSDVEGSIKLYGDDITNMDAEAITAKGLAQSPEGRQIFGDLTVFENLMIGAYTVKSKAVIDKSLKRIQHHFPVLIERSKQTAGTLSGGELQMIAIARALMCDPRVLLLDEPSLGLAPLIVRDIFKIIQEIKQEGTTVLLVEQNALQALKIADYGYVLELGKISARGASKELIRDERLIEAYLGKN